MAGQGSARVTLKEIDLSQVRSLQQLPQGVPAAVVGPARKGPAFVPQTFANMQQFNDVFGNMLERKRESNANLLGPLALNEWMRNAQAGTYIRVLGVGDGQKSTGGKVTDAGFVVGKRLVQEQSGDVGKQADNPHATINDSTAAEGVGKMHFLGCFMADQNNSNFIHHATGVDTTTAAVPVIRGLLMTPQGVVAAINPSETAGPQGLFLTVGENHNPRAVAHGKSFGNGDSLVGNNIGHVGSTNQEFKLVLNGFSNTNRPAVIDCSFDPSNPAYFSKVLNTDPTKIEELGHYLYMSWDVESSIAKPSNVGLTRGGGNLSDVAGFEDMVGFCLVSQGGGSNPEYEDFSSRYRAAKTPWVVSQFYGSSDSEDRSDVSDANTYKLFRLHALDDGEVSNDQFRLLVSNLRYDSADDFGSFDMSLEVFDSNPIQGEILASWKNLNLDPDSRNFIGRVIGDKHIYFDFDRDTSKQRLVEEGQFARKNNFVRVELSDDLLAGEVPVDALPSGFYGHSHLNTVITNNFEQGVLVYTDGGDPAADTNKLDNVQVLPMDFVKSISRESASSKEADDVLPWGVKFGKRKVVGHNELVEQVFNDSIYSWAKFLPDFGGVPVAKTDFEAANFQKGFFSLEKIRIKAANLTNDTIDSWNDSEYRREGDRDEGRFVNISKDAKGGNVRYLKFRCMFQGGFDGVNIFDKEKASFSDVASVREGEDETASSKFTGPTIMSYRKALDVLSDKSATEFQLLAVPGQRSPQVTDYAIRACEDRFDALYIMDILQKDASDQIIEDSLLVPHVRNTIGLFESRSLDSSFAAAYFPDVLVRRPSDRAPIVVPPSVGMLGVMSLNDTIADPWFAPAGLSRGRLSAIDSKLQMNRDLLDELYDADINPIYVPAGRPGEVYAFGQKTLLQDKSALDRINVRRLLIDIRRKVKKVGEQLLFEPNRASTLSRFSALVEPIMSDVQKRRGVTRYKIQIDSSTTTQNDIENNTIRGKIYLQPTKSVEFISLDFVVTNTIQQ